MPSANNPSIAIGEENGQKDQLRLLNIAKQQNKKTADKPIAIAQVLSDFNTNEKNINSFSIDYNSFQQNSTKIFNNPLVLTLTQEDIANICLQSTEEMELFKKRIQALLVDVDDVYFKTKNYLITNNAEVGMDASDTAGRIQNSVKDLVSDKSLGFRVKHKKIT